MAKMIDMTPCTRNTKTQRSYYTVTKAPAFVRGPVPKGYTGISCVSNIMDILVSLVLGTLLTCFLMLLLISL